MENEWTFKQNKREKKNFRLVWKQIEMKKEKLIAHIKISCIIEIDRTFLATKLYI